MYIIRCSGCLVFTNQLIYNCTRFIKLLQRVSEHWFFAEHVYERLALAQLVELLKTPVEELPMTISILNNNMSRILL